MSRLCVKNIPKYLTEERLREHFSAKGEVTDAKIIKTSDGYSRQFGFVGFRTDDEAQVALHYFDRSYLDTCRLACEIAYPVGDSHLSRPWSKYSEGSSAHHKVAEPKVEDEEKGSEFKHGRTKGKGEDGEEIKKDKDGKRKEVNGTKKGKAEEKVHGNEDEENDPLLQEFLEVMLPASKRRVWANDVAAAEDGAEAQKKGKAAQGAKSGKKKSLEKGDSKKGGRKGGKGKGGEEGLEDESLLSDGESGELYDNEVDAGESDGEVRNGGGGLAEPEVEETEEDEVREGAVQNEGVSDLEYLKSRVTEEWSDDDEEGEEDKEVDGEVEGEEDDERGPHQRGDEEEAGRREVDAEQQEGVAETGRLFVRNLCYTATEEDLRDLFSTYGELSEVHLVVDKETGRSKGFAYILFMLPENAVQAMRELDLSIFQGRLLHILPAKRPPPAREDRGRAGGSTAGSTQYKTEREEQRIASEVAGATQAWSTLFMRPDTVAENVAEKYGVEKRELLDPSADDLAVRLALGETHIIAQTKKGLEEQGVDVAALEAFAAKAGSGRKRSSRVILVKNLPFSATEADLVGMFGKFGNLGRVVLPPTKTLALMEYLEPSDARRAFKGLAYKRFQHVPLYLEWAPEGIMSEQAPAPPSQKKGASQTRSKEAGEGAEEVKRVNVVPELAPDDEDADTGEARSVFVKNLNFSTNERALKDHFQKAVSSGAIRSILIKKKKAANGKELSMGFGFVELDSAQTAKAICQELQGSVLDQHALVLQLSHGSRAASKRGALPEGQQAKQQRKESFTKVIVRNVAFEATKKDLRQLFNPFGQVKSLRIPKKFDGSHRGFAFVEFVTKQEAQSAFDALQNTHLYGRHLVLEKAKEGEGLDELRAKTAAHFHGDSAANPSKRIKLSELVDSMDAS